MFKNREGGVPTGTYPIADTIDPTPCLGSFDGYCPATELDYGMFHGNKAVGLRVCIAIWCSKSGLMTYQEQ